MTDLATALDRLTDLIAAARRLGADAADAAYAREASTNVSVRLGALEDVSRSDGEELSLRVFIGQKVASVSSSDLRPAALGALAERAVAMARQSLEDMYAGLADPALLMRGSPPDLALDDGEEPAPERLRAQALIAEEAARSVEGVTNSEGAGASAGRGLVALVTSTGFASGYATSSHGISASVIAGEGGAMQRDYAWHSARRRVALDDPGVVGRRAGERAVARLNPLKLRSEAMPILFDTRVAGGLIGHFLGAISGPAIARGTSFLLGRKGEAVFAPWVDILEEPLRRGGLRSRPFDSEGLPTRARRLVDRGVLGGWLIDSPSSRQLGEPVTGHASRGGGVSASNVYLAPGAQSREELIGGLDRAFLVTELIGMGVNPVTGDYSRGAAGFLIERGEIGPAVAEVTIAGNLADMFRAMTPASDLEFRRGIDAPTVLVEGMTVAGS